MIKFDRFGAMKAEGGSDMDRRHWTLLVLAAADGQPLEPVQLQKALFLIGKELDVGKPENFYDFAPFHYGPYDRQVYVDAELLAKDGLAVVDRPPGQSWRTYRATKEGIAAATNVAQAIPSRARVYVDQVVRWVKSLNFEQIVKAIYRAYPDTAVNSVFRG